jgi:hypothetical protein
MGTQQTQTGVGTCQKQALQCFATFSVSLVARYRLEHLPSRPILQTLGLNLRIETGYPSLDFTPFFSVPPSDKFRKN